MVVRSPIHPITRTARIPVLITKKTGETQNYWVSLKKFMEERKKGTSIQRIPRKQHKDIKEPDQLAPVYQIEFIENLEDFNVAGLEVGENEFEVEIVANVTVKKNGELVNTYPIKVNKEQVAREILKKIMR